MLNRCLCFHRDCRTNRCIFLLSDCPLRFGKKVHHLKNIWKNINFFLEENSLLLFYLNDVDAKSYTPLKNRTSSNIATLLTSIGIVFIFSMSFKRMELYISWFLSDVHLADIYISGQFSWNSCKGIKQFFVTIFMFYSQIKHKYCNNKIIM